MHWQHRRLILQKFPRIKWIIHRMNIFKNFMLFLSQLHWRNISTFCLYLYMDSYIYIYIGVHDLYKIQHFLLYAFYTLFFDKIINLAKILLSIVSSDQMADVSWSSCKSTILLIELQSLWALWAFTPKCKHFYQGESAPAHRR